MKNIVYLNQLSRRSRDILVWRIFDYYKESGLSISCLEIYEIFNQKICDIYGETDLLKLDDIIEYRYGMYFEIPEKKNYLVSISTPNHIFRNIPVSAVSQFDAVLDVIDNLQHGDYFDIETADFKVLEVIEK